MDPNLRCRDFIVGLGANLGSLQATLQAATQLLAAQPRCHLVATSNLFDSAAVGPPQPRYCNAALRLRSELSAPELLDTMLAIEAQLGRVRGERWGSRVIDLDLLWGPEPCDTPQLRLPHPHLHERAFALAPLLQVAPELAGAYAGTLERLGGPPARAAAPPSIKTRAGGSRLEVAGGDRPEQLAALGMALARRLEPREETCSPLQVLPIEVATGDAAAWLRALLAALGAGFCCVALSVIELAPDRIRGRLVATTTAPPNALPRLEMDWPMAAPAVLRLL
ncbi:MAG: 2-amino-4-hydroxy-6-hydroxymethyldihydropteridine diphosphokinase [Myxococcales bacterium]|nr:2-amino-4-hydroxy-6-hydroxymethyldihydropteridine diphosphokinase [Myxococcales bacterium]